MLAALSDPETLFYIKFYCLKLFLIFLGQSFALAPLKAVFR